MFTSILALFAVFSAAAFAQNATTGWAIRTDYTDAGCTNEYRVTSFKIDACISYTYLIAHYVPASNQIQVNYFGGDSKCNATGAATSGSTATYTIGACNPSSSPFIFTYETNFHTLEENVRIFATFDPAGSNCNGDLFSVEQYYPVCFANPNKNGVNSSTIKCDSDTESTQTDCPTNDCSGDCTPTTEQVSPTRCDTGNQYTTSCTVPERLKQLEATTTSTPITPGTSTTGKSSQSTGVSGSTGSTGATGGSTPSDGSTDGGAQNSDNGGQGTTTSSASFVVASVAAILFSFVSVL